MLQEFFFSCHEIHCKQTLSENANKILINHGMRLIIILIIIIIIIIIINIFIQGIKHNSDKQYDKNILESVLPCVPEC